MSYDPNTPQATDRIASTQPLILGNFTYINTVMKVNHTWNGNAIAAEPVGSHQRLDMPNQPVDIAALPAGIADVLYAIGGNIFAYNGAKQPVSGITGSGVVTLTNVPQTIFTVPPNCMGFFTLSDALLVVPIGSFWIFASIPVGATGNPPAWSFPITTAIPLAGVFSGLDFKLSRINPGSTDHAYKFIYWPI